MRVGTNPHGQIMRCAICGTKDYDKLIIHDLGMAVGMSGDDYCFCYACWLSTDLGEKLLDMLGHKYGMFYKFKSIKVTGRKDKAFISGGAS